MIQHHDLYERAAIYHLALTDRIRKYLNTRGIPDMQIDMHLLGWTGRRIAIPIYDANGALAFFKFAKDPEGQRAGPKFMSTPGSSVELYGWEEITRRPQYVIICEGEFDRLVLEANGFIAVTSTGGAVTFREEWIPSFSQIPQVYICYDRDAAGQRGALKVGLMIPGAKLVALPAEVGDGGDVTDFFVRLGKTREDFIALLKKAEPVPPPPEPVISYDPPTRQTQKSADRERIERIKQETSIVDLIGRYVKLRTSGNTLLGRCPFHNDRTPSLAVYPNTRTFYCFACLKHGDVISFVQEIEHLSFGQALDTLDSVNKYHGGEPETGK